MFPCVLPLPSRCCADGKTGNAECLVARRVDDVPVRVTEKMPSTEESDTAFLALPRPNSNFSEKSDASNRISLLGFKRQSEDRQTQAIDGFGLDAGLLRCS